MWNGSRDFLFYVCLFLEIFVVNDDAIVLCCFLAVASKVPDM